MDKLCNPLCAPVFSSTTTTAYLLGVNGAALLRVEDSDGTYVGSALGSLPSVPFAVLPCGPPTPASCVCRFCLRSATRRCWRLEVGEAGVPLPWEPFAPVSRLQRPLHRCLVVMPPPCHLGPFSLGCFLLLLISELPHCLLFVFQLFITHVTNSIKFPVANI